MCVCVCVCVCVCFVNTQLHLWKCKGNLSASQVAVVVKNPPASAADIRDEDSIPGLGRPPGGRQATHSSILAWRIPWTEQSGGLWTTGSYSQTQLKGLAHMHIFL